MARSFFRKTLFFFFLLSLLFVFTWTKRNEWIPLLLEKWAGQTQSLFFGDTLQIDGFNLKNDLRVSIDAIHGTWQTEQGGFPFELKGVELTDPITHFIFRKPAHVRFSQLRPQASPYPGMDGEILLFNDEAETFELNAAFIGLYLEELIALNPEALRGSSGKMTGSFYLKAQKSGDQELRLTLQVVPPGGRLQAHFFDLLLPYLPLADKQALATIRAKQTVAYKEANIGAELVGQDSLKILLNIKVPEYNLNLNLNLTLRVEENEAFFNLVQIMGLIKAGNT